MDLSSDWISAVASVGALSAAVWAARTAKQVHDMEFGRDRTSADERFRASARLVSAWTAVYLPDGPEGAIASDGVVIANRSSTPIFDIEIASTDKTGNAQPSLRLQVLPPGEYYCASTSGPYHWKYPDVAQAFPGNLRPIAKKPEWRVVDFTFNDAAGRPWRRDRTGLLESRLTSDEIAALLG